MMRWIGWWRRWRGESERDGLLENESGEPCMKNGQCGISVFGVLAYSWGSILSGNVFYYEYG
jgi:hypothetical protein